MRRKILTTATTLVAAAGLALSLTACDAADSLSLNSPRATATTVELPASSDYPDETTQPPSTLNTQTFRSTPASTSSPVPSEFGSSSSGGIATFTTATGTARRSKIYQNSEGFDFLATPGRVVPGGKFTTSASKSCSFGWMVYARKDPRGRKYMVTAGHCGKAGDQVYIRDKAGHVTKVGEIVNSTGGLLSNGSDYALIEVTNAKREAQLPLNNPVFDGWQSQEWVAANNPKICRLGYRTGVSCGRYLQMKNNTIFYEGIQDHGDSGGPVWAETTNGKRYAIAVTSYGFNTDATTAGAAALEPWMKKFGLGIYTS